ncbi:MAG: hypothetical protein KAG53_11985, partial [Endozoicomonadaceae bacterium]|nr:hypothetical protein [Endozoicomonadaceae bacterium]
MQQSIDTKQNTQSIIDKNYRSHLIAKVPWQATSYFKCRRCKKTSFLASGFKKIGPCYTKVQSQFITERDVKHMRLSVGLNSKSRLIEKNTIEITYTSCCPGCGLSNFKNPSELYKHHKQKEQKNIYFRYKCTSCYFSCNDKNAFEEHKTNVSKKNNYVITRHLDCDRLLSQEEYDDDIGNECEKLLASIAERKPEQAALYTPHESVTSKQK